MQESIVIVACSFRLTPERMKVRLTGLLGKHARKVRGFIVSSSAKVEQDMGDGWTLLPTDNIDFDFSAYFVGVEAIFDRCPNAKTVLFVNDTLFTNHAAAANLCALWRNVGLMQEIELPAISGKADFYKTICLKNPWSNLDRYITTFCFMLNRPALDIMRLLRLQAYNDDVTHDFSLEDPAWGARLPLAFRQFLKANLIFKSSPYLWYRLKSEEYTEAQIRSKARTIYFEHRISGEIGSLGCLLPSNSGLRWSTYLAINENLQRIRRKFTFWHRD